MRDEETVESRFLESRDLNQKSLALDLLHCVEYCILPLIFLTNFRFPQWKFEKSGLH